MAVPNYQEILLPVLEFTKDGVEHSMQDAINHIIGYYKLTESQQKETIPSEKPVINNRVGWARTYLKKAGLLSSPKRSYIQITQRGLDVLKEKRTYIDMNYLKKFPEFLEFIHFNSKNLLNTSDEKRESKTPEEIFEESYQYLRANLAQEILEKIKKLSPRFFEQLVVDLFLAMGYGGSRAEAGRAIGQKRGALYRYSAPQYCLGSVGKIDVDVFGFRGNFHHIT